MTQYNKHFPGTQKYIYADTAACGLFHQNTIQWRREQDVSFMSQGSLQWMEGMAIITETRQRLARFFGGDPEQVALLPNFSLGLNLILEGLSRDEKVLLLRNDYPSVNWPFDSRGFDIEYLDIEEDLESQIWERVEKDGITVLAISLVQWLDGIRIAPSFLKKLKEAFPQVLIIADGTQSCGAFPIDFQTTGIDILGASGYKWLLGGYGNGFFIFRDDLSDRIRIPSIGMYAADGQLEARDQISFARRLEPGHLSVLSFGTLNHSLRWMEENSAKKLYEVVEQLSEKARQVFGALGLLSPVVLQREQHGAIFKLTEKPGMKEALQAHKVVFSSRGGGIRLSFHLYNTEQEVDMIANVLKSVI